MKTSQYSVNPARGTRWSIKKGSKLFCFTVISTISTGYAHCYDIQSYELKYDHLEAVQVVPAHTLLELIDNKTVLPYYNENGSLLADGYEFN